MGLLQVFRRPATTQHHERSATEKSLVFRLDVFLMTFGCISQVIKYLDQQNINNAFTTYFNIAYCLMLIPSQVILTYVRPSQWLPGLEILWGLMTGLIATAHTAKQVYILRFFLGLCESSAWPGMITLFMHWYTPTELAKRMGFYHSCQAFGSMMSGALQVAITETLDGTGGLSGWRWLFVINAIMTVVWGFLGFFMIPDLPNRPNPRAFWFTSEHANMAMERLSRNNRAAPKKMTLAGVKRTFSTWVVYFISVLYISSVLGSAGYGYFSLFLKSLRNSDGTKTWSTSQVNAIPIGGGAIQVVLVWTWAFLSDFLGTRSVLIIAQAAVGVVPCIVMTVWTSHPASVALSAAYASYFICYLTLGTAPLIFSWLSDIIPQDPEARSLIVGVAVAGYYAVSAWSQVLVWPASQAPYYHYGWQSALALWLLVIIMTCILRYIDVRFMLPKRLAFASIVGRDVEEDRESLGRHRQDEDDIKTGSKIQTSGLASN